MRKRSATSRNQRQSINYTPSMTSFGFQKLGNNMLNRSSTSQTLYDLISTDPKFMALASMAELVQKLDAFVSNCSIIFHKQEKTSHSQ